jgi:hypothetical protein
MKLLEDVMTRRQINPVFLADVVMHLATYHFTKIREGTTYGKAYGAPLV